MEDKTLFYFNHCITEHTVKNVDETLQGYVELKYNDTEDPNNRWLWINSIGGVGSEFFPLLNIFKRYFKIILGGPDLESLAFLLWLSYPIENRYVLDNTLALFHNGSTGKLRESDKYQLEFRQKKLEKEDKYFHKLMQKNLQVKNIKDVEDMALRENNFDCDELRSFGLLDIEEGDSESHIIQKESILESRLIIL